MNNLKTRYSANIELKNPLVAASSGLTGTGEKLKKLEDTGIGAAVMKSLFEDDKCRKDPTPRYKFINRGKGKLKSYTFYSYEQASPFGPQEYAKEILTAKESVDFPVIGSIACTSDKGWETYSKLIEEAGADGIELNLSCPYSDHIREHRNMMDDFIKNTLEIVRETVNIDVVCKMTPQLSSPASIALLMENNGAQGITAFSRFAGLDIDLENEMPVMHGGYAGHGGSWSLFYALRWISEFSPSLTIPVSGSGGIHDENDIIKYILAGASSTQLCTILYGEGCDIIEKFISGLKEYMNKKGYSEIDSFKGTVSSKILSMHQVDRVQRVKAAINISACTACGTCNKICNYNAVEKMDDNTYSIIQSCCSGCGLCVELCPQKAITFNQI